MVACVLLGAAMLCGCTPKKTDEMIIRESVADVLGNFKSPDGEMSKRFISEMDINELGNVGLSTTDFMKAYTDGFSYEISSISINGNNAEVVISMHVKSFSEFEKKFANAIKVISGKYEVINKEENTSADLSAQSKIVVTTEEMNSMFTRTIINCLKDTPLREVGPITIQYTNENYTWKPAPKSLDEILTLMLSN